MHVICNHCGNRIEHEELDLDIEDYEINPPINSANRVIDCPECGCEVFFNSKIYKVIEVSDYEYSIWLKNLEKEKHNHKGG